MLSAIAIIPSAPVMVPELAAGAAAELADLREAVFAAAAIAARAVDRRRGRGRRRRARPASRQARSPATASTCGSRCRPAPPTRPRELPLCALVAGWLRGQVKPEAHAEVRVYAGDHDVDAALTRGRRLRAEIDEAADPVGVLVVADGAHTLTPPAPGGYDPDSIPVQAALDDALAAGDAAALTRLPDAIVGRVAYQVLAGLDRPAPRSAKELYRGAPYGVGYFVGVWQP